MRALPPLSALLLVGVAGVAFGPGPAQAGPAAAVDLRWRLAASSLLPFRTMRVDGFAPGGLGPREARKAEALVPAPDVPHGVFGFEVVGGRDHRAVVHRLPHLPFHLACRLPERLDPAKPTAVQHRYEGIWEHAPVRCAGTWTLAALDEAASTAEVVGEFELSSPDVGRHPWSISKGRASVRVGWDLAAGLPRTLRYEAWWERRRTTPSATDPNVVPEARAFDLEALPVRAVDDASFQGDVDAAIARGVEAIRRAQRPSGAWEAWYEYEAGPTAIALLTLLESDVDRADPAVERGIAALLARRPKKTYETALALMAVDAWRTPETERARRRRGEPVPAPVRTLPDEERAYVRRAVDSIVWNAEHNRAVAGIGYLADRPDLSNTQYAALGLRAAAACGAEAPEATWASLLDYALRCQEPQGPTATLDLEREGDRPGGTRAAWRVPARGAGYESPTRPTASMTSAAIGTLRIAEEALARARSPARRRRAGEVEAAVRSAFAWLATHYSVRLPWDTEDDRVTYALYGLERACVLDGVRRLSGRDWYREGALWLLHVQREDGSFPAYLHDTCFALLFLKRATAPRVVTGG